MHIQQPSCSVVSCCVSYILPLLFVGKPSPALCGVRRFAALLLPTAGRVLSMGVVGVEPSTPNTPASTPKFRDYNTDSSAVPKIIFVCEICTALVIN